MCLSVFGIGRARSEEWRGGACGHCRPLVLELANGDSVAACPPGVGDVDELAASGALQPEPMRSRGSGQTVCAWTTAQNALARAAHRHPVVGGPHPSWTVAVAVEAPTARSDGSPWSATSRAPRSALVAFDDRNSGRRRRWRRRGCGGRDQVNEHDPDDETLLRVLLEQVARRGETSPMDLELAAAWVASPDPAAAALGRYQLTDALLPTVLAVADPYAQRAAGPARPARPRPRRAR